MFQLTKDEYESLRFQMETLKAKEPMSSQFVMTYPSKRPNTALPYAFTEQGVAMLSDVLNSDKAINMNPDSYRDHNEGFCRSKKSAIKVQRFKRTIERN